MIDNINEPKSFEIINEIKTDRDIIDSYIKGTLSGIYIKEDCFFIKLRVTGLGITKRLDEYKSIANLTNALKNVKNIEADSLANLDLNELVKIAINSGLSPYNFLEYRMVDRQEKHFASDDILELYAGLPIIVNHPDNNSGFLNFENFKYNCIVGSIIKAYKHNNAVFAVARIYDLNVLDKLKQFKSTSPAVMSVEVENYGTNLELPYNFNHLAFVEDGHWDIISDYAIDTTKYTIEKEDRMPIVDVIEKNKADAITDKIATPETKDIKADDDFKSTIAENANDADVVEVKDEDVEEVEAGKVDFAPVRAFTSALGSLQGDSDDVAEIKKEAIEAKDEAKADDDVETEIKDEAKEDAKDAEVAKADDDENKEVKAEIEVAEVKDEPKAKTFAEDITDSGVTDVTKSVVCNEDKEREALIDAMRSVVDSVSLKDVKMPYIEGRKKPSVVIKQILNANKGYVDSKYTGIIDSDSSYKNYSLCVDAFNSMLKNIKATDAKNKNQSVKEAQQAKGWVATSSNPNILVDRNF